MSVQAPAARIDRDRAAVSLPGCGLGRRILAHAIDLAAVAGLAAAAYLPTGSVLLGAVIGLEVALGLAVWEARSGRTLGKHLLGIRAAQAQADYAPGLRRAMVRSVLLGLSHALALVGQFLLIATSRLDRTGRGQAWHDRVAGTRVVNIRADAHLKAPTPRYAPGSARGAPTHYQVSPGRGPHDQPGPVPQHQPGQPLPHGGYIPPAPAHQGPPGHNAPSYGHTSAAPSYGQYTAGPDQQPSTGAVPGQAPVPAGYGQVPPGQGAGAPAQHPPAGGPAHDRVPPPVSGAPQQYRGGGAHHAPGTPGTAVPPGASSSAPSSTQGLPEHTFDPAQRPVTPADPRTLDPAELPDLDVRDGAQEGAVFVLTVDDGVSVTVSGPGLIGRRPQAGPAERVAHLVAVDDPGRSLSRTHAAFGIDGADLWVEDRGSANGTVVVGADGAITRVFPGKRVPVPEDGRIEVGERTVMVQRWQA